MLEATVMKIDKVLKKGRMAYYFDDRKAEFRNTEIMTVFIAPEEQL